MNISIDSVLANQTMQTAYQPSSLNSGSGEFASYLTDAMRGGTSGAQATLQSDPSMAMQSVMSMMFSGSVGGDSNDMLTMILMYLLMGRDDESLGQLEEAYAPGESDAERQARVEAARKLPNFELNSDIVQSAITRLGDPYSQKKAGRDDYTDCSYLTRWCYRAAGVELPRTAAAQAKYLVDNGMTVSREELKPGDLIFYSFKENGRYRNISHVGIYAGNGKMVDASSANGKVVYRDMFEGALVYGRPGVAKGQETAQV